MFPLKTDSPIGPINPIPCAIFDANYMTKLTGVAVSICTLVFRFVVEYFVLDTAYFAYIVNFEVGFVTSSTVEFELVRVGDEGFGMTDGETHFVEKVEEG